jgi:hypothetical protein
LSISARRQLPKLPAGLLAPQQESPNRTAPLLNRRRREAALVAHPSDVLVELALVRERHGGFTPPAKKPQPWSPDINDPPRSGGCTMKILPLLRDRHQLGHADAAVGVRTETSRNPQELVVFDLQNRGPRSVHGTVAQIAMPFVSEWCVFKALIGDVAERAQMTHGEPPEVQGPPTEVPTYVASSSPQPRAPQGERRVDHITAAAT